MKKVLAVILAVCMIAAFGVTAHADAADYPWGNLDVARIVFAEGFTTIQAEPFAGMSGLETVVLPASVTAVEPEAFADSKVAAVQSVGDVALDEVAAFADAEVSAMSQEEFDALVAEVEAAATETADTYSYDGTSKTLLVKGVVKKVAGQPFYYEEGSGTAESAASATYTVTYPLVNADGVVIGTATVTYDTETGREIAVDLQGEDNGYTFEQHITYTYTSDNSRQASFTYKDSEGNTDSGTWNENLVDNQWVREESQVTPSQNESEVANG